MNLPALVSIVQPGVSQEHLILIPNQTEFARGPSLPKHLKHHMRKWNPKTRNRHPEATSDEWEETPNHEQNPAKQISHGKHGGSSGSTSKKGSGKLLLILLAYFSGAAVVCGALYYCFCKIGPQTPVNTL